MTTKVCETCNSLKPFDATADKNTRASGFCSNKCWKCWRVYKNEANAKTHAKYDAIYGEGAYGRATVAKTYAKYDAIHGEGAYAKAATARKITKHDAIHGVGTYYREAKAKATATPMGHLRQNMSVRLSLALKNIGANKPTKTENIVGCNWSELAFHISKQFKPGMTWENYGTVWEVDHRIPCDYAKDVATMCMLFDFTNLQPMFTRENRTKLNKHCKIEARTFIDSLMASKE